MPILTWAVCGAAIAAILLRPRRIPEWVWAVGGALALVALGLERPSAALVAVRRGSDVYLFLTGMLVLAEIARTQGVFEWLAMHALAAARGSQERLFALVYGVCVVVTAFLSNDATAVVLTPAIGAVVTRARVAPLPYLYACAFVANAASFALPFSNPANLVLYGARLPLGPWFAAFCLPSFASIATTYGMLRLLARRTLRAPFNVSSSEVEAPARHTAVAAAAVGVGVIGMLVANAEGAPLGAATFLLGCAALAAVLVVDRRALRTVVLGVTWSIVPLVAGLFVIVQALDASGTLAVARRFVAFASTLSPAFGKLLVTAGVTAVANVANNLPVAVVGALVLHRPSVTPTILHATVAAVDLGPNLSVSGSLATLLWLAALRRGGIVLTPLQFLRVGALVALPALILCALAVR